MMQDFYLCPSPFSLLALDDQGFEIQHYDIHCGWYYLLFVFLPKLLYKNPNHLPFLCENYLSLYLLSVCPLWVLCWADNYHLYANFLYKLCLGLSQGYCNCISNKTMLFLHLNDYFMIRYWFDLYRIGWSKQYVKLD